MPCEGYSLRLSHVGLQDWWHWEGNSGTNQPPQAACTVLYEGALRVDNMAFLAPRGDHWYEPYEVVCEPRIMDTPINRQAVNLEWGEPDARIEGLRAIQEIAQDHMAEIQPMIYSDELSAPDFAPFPPRCWQGQTLILPVDYLKLVRIGVDRRRGGIEASLLLGQYVHFGHAWILRPGRGCLEWHVPDEILDPILREAVLAVMQEWEDIRVIATRLCAGDSLAWEFPMRLAEFRTGAAEHQNLRAPYFEPAPTAMIERKLMKI